MIEELNSKNIILAKRPDLVLKLEKFGIELPLNEKRTYSGCAKKWAKEGKAPYDNPDYQALAERLPVGWEELTRKEFDTIIERLKNTIAAKKTEPLHIQNPGDRVIFKKLTQLLITGAAVLATCVTKQGIGRLPEKNDKEIRSANIFSFDLVLEILLCSGTLDQICKCVADLLETDDENRKKIVEILRTLSVFASLLTATRGDKDEFIEMVASNRDAIQTCIENLYEFADFAIKKGELSSRRAQDAVLFKNKALKALQEEQYEIFYDAYCDVLTLIETSHEKLAKDLLNLQNEIFAVSEQIKGGIDEAYSKTTDIQRAV